MSWIIGWVRRRRIGRESARESLVESFGLDRSVRVVNWALPVDFRSRVALEERIFVE